MFALSFKSRDDDPTLLLLRNCKHDGFSPNWISASRERPQYDASARPNFPTMRQCEMGWPVIGAESYVCEMGESMKRGNLAVPQEVVGEKTPFHQQCAGFPFSGK